MKLLLTSGGISNHSIAKAFGELVSKNPSEVKVGYIPIAANVEAGNKDWVIKDFLNLWRYGYSQIDIVDPSAAGVNWETRLADVDVVALSGGNTFHLLDQVRKTGLDGWLKTNLGNKVYVGGSASSILVTPSIGAAGIGSFHDENLPNLKDLAGLGFVDFEIVPHVPGWGTYKDCEQYSAKTSNKLYALDDSSAIKIDGDKVEIISEGVWKLYNG
ncbi:MAG TPA: Type 1 glutamine amidotransferase-like domain-containing protein [Candidatus Nitrosopolaris sp.]|nr:Type 1 glutamine amidotransferase-like domain-containing protein [Candidatus Nitrosopolaris sp.]